MSIIVIYLYLLLGAYLFGTNKLPHYEDIYIIALCFITMKVITNYRTCSVAYAECKIRRAKRNESYVNQFLDPIIDVRYSDHIYIVVPLVMFVLYYYFITKGILRNIHNKVFNYNKV